MCARRLTERRHKLGLTQCEVVERLRRLGVASSNRALSAMEHGQGLDVGRLPELAGALDCTVTYLLGLTEDPQRWTPDDTPVPVTGDLTVPIAGWILAPEIPDRASSLRHA
jgi:transcriptional regulator with XRE-family HTH domain